MVAPTRPSSALRASGWSTSPKLVLGRVQGHAPCARVGEVRRLGWSVRAEAGGLEEKELGCGVRLGSEAE